MLFLAGACRGYGQSDGFGVFTGWPGWLEAQYQAGPVRFDAGFSYFGLGAGVDGIIEFPLDVAPDMDLSWYCGGGVSAAVWTLVAVGGTHIFPHALAGAEVVPSDCPVSIFAEVQLGPDFNSTYLVVPYLGRVVHHDIDFGVGARVGVIWRK
jgi:hypothetical protein